MGLTTNGRDQIPAPFSARPGGPKTNQKQPKINPKSPPPRESIPHPKHGVDNDPINYISDLLEGPRPHKLHFPEVKINVINGVESKAGANNVTS